MSKKYSKISKIPKTTKVQGIETVPKHNSTIHISSELSFLSRKLMNALLFQAYDYLPVQQTHEVDIKTLGALIGFDSKNTAHLKEAITELTHSTVEWDILKPNNKKHWKISTLLAMAEIKDGVCRYEYSSVLREELYDPDKWTRINLAIQREFSSSYALILYENCVRFKDIKTTGLWDIDDFRKLLGVDDIPSYQEFKVLNARIIKPAVQEVNKYSDIIIKPYFTKNGRRISTVRFTIKENTQVPLFKIEEEDQITQSKAYKELISRKMSKIFSRQAVIDFGEEYIFEQLGIADHTASKTNISSKQGLIQKAISEGYSKPDKLLQQDHVKEADKKRQRTDKISSQIEILDKKKRKIEREYRVMFVEMVQSVFDVSSLDEQKGILDEFTSKYPLSTVTAHDFQANRWQSLLNWSSIQEYWLQEHSLPCPTFEAFSLERGVLELDEKLSMLKAQ